VWLLFKEGKVGKDGILTNMELIENGLPSFEETHKKFWTELNIFFHRPWFHRVWIIQEVVVSKDVNMICGSRKALWSIFIKAASLLINVRVPWLNLKGCRRIRRMQQYKDDPPIVTTAALLILERSALATDDREHIFALLGLAAKYGNVSNRQNRASISVDYTLSTAEVYLYTALYLAKSSGTLEFLGAAGSLPRPQKNKLPSWVPDWSFPLVKYPFMGPREIIYHDGYNACQSKWSGCELSIHENMLSVKGVRFDYLWAVGEAIQDSPDDERMSDHRAIFRAWRLMIQGNPDLQSRYDDARQAFWRTITGDRWSDGRRIGREHSKYFKTWVEDALELYLDFVDRRYTTVEEGQDAERATELPSFRSLIFCYGRKFFITRGGYMGIGPFGMEKEDVVCLVEGACVPLILRDVERVFLADGHQTSFQIRSKNQFQYIGDSYVHGIMDGEGFDPSSCEEFVVC
jgi:hypothetical protein